MCVSFLAAGALATVANDAAAIVTKPIGEGISGAGKLVRDIIGRKF